MHKCLGCNREVYGQTTATDMSVAFDVDDTIVMWDCSKELEDKTILITDGVISSRVLPHEKHIEQIKRHAARGHTVYIWSAGGREWAKSVVKALGLEPYIYDVICKFQWYYDDLKSDQFLHENNRFYYDYKTGRLLNHKSQKPTEET